MARQRRSLGVKILVGVFALVVCLLILCLIQLVSVSVTGEGIEAQTVRQVCIAAVAAIIFGVAAFSPEPEPVAQASQPDPAGAPGARALLEGMLAHSEDVLATLRDIAAHGGSDFGDLPELLRRTGLMDWQNPPAVRAHRLSRNGRWWLLEPTSDDATAHDRVVAVEAALNLSEDLAARPAAPRGMLKERARSVLAGSHRLRPVAHGGDDHVGRLHEFLTEGTDERGEWACRARFADAVENLPLPVRMEVAFWANVASGLLCAHVIVPRPACLASVCSDEASRERVVTGYAARVALAIAREAFASSPALTRVVVTCAHDSEETLVSLDAPVEALGRLERLMDGDVETLPSDPTLRVRTGAEGEPEPLDLRHAIDDEQLFPSKRYREVDLDDAPAGKELAGACGARRLSDLGIMERTGRAQAWWELAPQLGDTTQGAVSLLVGLRDRTGDVTVAEACDRVSKALVDGTIDVSATDELERLFVDGSSLATVTGRVRAALAEECSPTRLEGLLAELDEVLSPITSMGIYLDDSSSVYRYFNSYPERVRYNLTFCDDERSVRLVPDEYYNAHMLSARILNLLGRHGEATGHADELMRVAPVTPDASLMKVRVLEGQSRIFEAADLLVEAIGYASTPRDLAVCFYRLAFMEWKLGRGDLTVACYQRSIDLHPEIAEMAREELGYLLRENDDLRPLPVDGVTDALAQGGLPTGDVARMRQETRDALVATTDAGVFTVARALSGNLCELADDDALLDVRRSLTLP